MHRRAVATFIVPTGKQGQEVGTKYSLQSLYTKPLHNKRMSSQRHLLISHDAHVVHSVIPIVNLPVFSITATGFHHCSSCVVTLLYIQDPKSVM